MKRLIAVAVLAGFLAYPIATLAQGDRMRIGESLAGKVIRADKSEFDVGVKVEGGKSVVDRGSFAATKLPNHIGVVYGFLIHWGRGKSSAPPTLLPHGPKTPVAANGKTYELANVQLILPFRGLSSVRADGVPVAVRVSTVGGVTTPDGPVTGTVIVLLAPRQDNPNKFAVIGVSVE